MPRQKLLLSMVLITGLTLAGCSDGVRSPAPVLNFGQHSDSSNGAMIVAERDTVWNIAKRYRLPLRNIIELNELQPPYTLSRGQRLKLPAPVDYRVAAGDTLYSIANTFAVDVSRLVRVNALRAPYSVRPGQNLRIPFMHHRKEAPEPEKYKLAAVPVEPVVREVQQRHRTLSPRRPEGPPPVTTFSSRGSRFIWPVHGKVISGYGPKDGGLYNDGINIAVPKGTPVMAAADGVVAYVGNDLKSYGNLVLLRHGNGMMTAYAHLASVRVKKGMTVKRGQALGTVGSTGSVSSAQLHFEIRQKSKTLDPRQYL